MPLISLNIAIDICSLHHKEDNERLRWTVDKYKRFKQYLRSLISCGKLLRLGSFFHNCICPAGLNVNALSQPTADTPNRRKNGIKFFRPISNGLLEELADWTQFICFDRHRKPLGVHSVNAISMSLGFIFFFCGLSIAFWNSEFSTDHIAPSFKFARVFFWQQQRFCV